MRVLETIRKQIRDAISYYDFEDYIEKALEDIDIEELVAEKLEEKMQDIDLSDRIARLIEDAIENELDGWGIEEEIIDAMKEQLN